MTARPLFVAPSDAPDFLGVRRTKLYELLSAGALAAKIGAEAPAVPEPEPPAKRPRGRPRKLPAGG